MSDSFFADHNLPCFLTAFELIGERWKDDTCPHPETLRVFGPDVGSFKDVLPFCDEKPAEFKKGIETLAARDGPTHEEESTWTFLRAVLKLVFKGKFRESEGDADDADDADDAGPAAKKAKTAEAAETPEATPEEADKSDGEARETPEKIAEEETPPVG